MGGVGHFSEAIAAKRRERRKEKVAAGSIGNAFLDLGDLRGEQRRELRVGQDSLRGLNAAGSGARACSAFIHSMSTGSRSKAIESATCAGMFSQRISSLRRSGRVLHAVMTSLTLMTNRVSRNGKLAIRIFSVCRRRINGGQAVVFCGCASASMSRGGAAFGSGVWFFGFFVKIQMKQ